MLRQNISRIFLQFSGGRLLTLCWFIMMVFLQTSHHATLKTLISKQLLSKISHFLKVIYFLSIVGSRKKSIPNHRDHHYQNLREAGSRSKIFLISLVNVGMYVCIYLFVCVTPPGRTKNDTDLKFYTHLYNCSSA